SAARRFLVWAVVFILTGSSHFVRRAETRVGSGDSPFECFESNADQATYTLSGAVINSVTGEPIGRALVQLNINPIAGHESANDGAPAERRLTLTDRQGHFRFEGLSRTRVSLSAKKPGFFTERELAEGQSREDAVEVGPNVPTVLLKLTPEAVIIGHV